MKGSRTDYGSSSRPDQGVVASVQQGSPAQRAGIGPGDRIVSVDDHTVQDIIDWQWWADSEAHVLVVENSQIPGDSRVVQAVRRSGESWGIEFSAPLFDRIRTCRNDCAFCFMAQLPQDLRTPLYVRDDDFRLSFLHGNFITLTNMTESDIARIDGQRLSPLYVSLHAVDLSVREDLISPHGSDRALEYFDRLLECGIGLHVQIVLVPGVNDGDVLERTLTWLAERVGVISVGIVPLGFTRHQSRYGSAFENGVTAAAVLAQVEPWREAMRERDGVSWVHLADEFYINAAAPLPITEHYDGYPQYENGIGIVRSFVDDVVRRRGDLLAVMSRLPAKVESLTLVTGTMAATTLAGALEACGGVGRVRLLVVPNGFFGGNVSVAGLLAGADIANAIQSDDHEGTYLIPDVALNADGLTVDGWTVSRLSERTGARIVGSSTDVDGLIEGIKTAID